MADATPASQLAPGRQTTAGVWNPRIRAELRARVARLTPEHPARWGRFTAPAMLAHLNESLRMAIGDLVVPAKSSPVRRAPLKQLVVYLLPIPREVPTAPALLVLQPVAWTDRVAHFGNLLERFAARSPKEALPEHPMFGRLSARAWGILVQRHADHHLRQFGV